jgi:hypothetical protein
MKIRYVAISKSELSKFNDERERGQYSINFVMQGGVYDRVEERIVCVVDDMDDAWRITQAMNLCA